MDVYRLLALHAQSNLKVYKEDAADEDAAKVVTKKAHEKRMREALDKMNALYKGKGEPLFRRRHFALVAMDKKTAAFRRAVHSSAINARAGIKTVIQWAFNNIIKKEPVSQHFIFYVYETGKVFYCSQPEFNDKSCATMIGYSLYKKWMIAPKELVDPLMRKTDKDYLYYAIVQNTANEDGKGI